MNTHISNIVEAEVILATYIPQVTELLGKDLTLKRMDPLMKLLDHPENKIKLIHVAGTSGKTSTAYYVANLLKLSGKKVGLTVSPHIDSITERVQIDLMPISEAEFCKNLSEFLSIIQYVEPRPTYFELIIAFVYWYFAKADVDYAVIETGLGGSYDATNVAKAATKVCVITDIGLDHMNVLGNTIAQIASQKAGIIHYSNHVFMYKQQKDVLDVVERYAAQQGATIHLVDDSLATLDTHLNTLPLYQQRNWLLAKSVFDFVSKRDDIIPIQDDISASSMDIQVPGRMDITQLSGKTIIMDGAHNEQKMGAFVNSFQTKFPDQKAAILLSLKKGKEFEAVLPLLKPICSSLIITIFPKAQDLPTPAIEPEVLYEAAKKFGFNDVCIEKDYQKAYQMLVTKDTDLCIITGSFYLIASIRRAMANK